MAAVKNSVKMHPSDGGAQTHGVSVPTNGTTFTASYVQLALSLGAANPAALTLQWPAWSSPFSLWSATNLASPISWQQVTNPPVSTNGNLLLTLPATNSSLFYRLQFP